MAHDAARPHFRDLIDEHAPVRQIGSGFIFTEGPIWHPLEHHLLFSDMPGDVRRRWDRERRSRGHAAGQQGQRHDLRCRSQPVRLRARHVERSAVRA
jgi:sugar lactone lactonase YvrE